MLVSVIGFVLLSSLLLFIIESQRQFEKSRISSPSVGLFKWVLAGDKNLTLEKDKFETKKGVGKRRLSLGGDRARSEKEMESEGTKKPRWNNILD